MTEFLTTTWNAGVLTVTIDRPDKRNALSRRLLEQIGATFRTWKARDDLIVAVLTGSGSKAFASGGDLKELSAMKSEAEALAFAADARAQLDEIRFFPVPVVAALNGDAIGGGAELALACDARIAARHARIGMLQGQLAIATAWGGGNDLFQLVGHAQALELLCMATLIDAGRALDIGLLDAVAEGDDFTEFVTGHIGRLSRKPQIMRAFKALAIMYRSGASPAEKAATEGAYFAKAWTHQDHWAAVAAFENARLAARGANFGGSGA